MSHIEDVLRSFMDTHMVLSIWYDNETLTFNAVLNDEDGECVGAKGNTLADAIEVLNQRCWDEVLVDLPA